MTLDDATRAQNDAASPEMSTWLSANAGSGKTRVLTDRVARLLLGGADPQNILCLTYTKAAAGEMQNRLFEQLGRWAMLSDDALRKELRQKGETPPTDLSLARTLFARAVETPGGLKIQTIHSFCSALLRQFPLEAGVSPGFRELDDRGQADLVSEVLDDLAETHAETVIAVSRQFSGETLTDLARTVLTYRADFQKRMTEVGFADLFGISQGLTPEKLLRNTLSLKDLGFLKSAGKVLVMQSSVRDQQLGMKLTELPDNPSFATLEILESCLLTGATATSPFAPKTGAIPTKATRTGAFAPFLTEFEDIIERVAEARGKRLALVAKEQSEKLHRFAQLFLPAYAEAKASRGVLDFDDLISRAGALLGDRSYDWVLYRLDGRIDHILVDEAQDTSPAQWSVIGALAQEIAAGEGARQGRARSLFVVGDKKQSIYSFQGADADAFEAMSRHFKERMTGGMAQRELLHSFRSSPAILRAVDATFAGGRPEAFGRHVEHLAFFDELPGRVDLWPLQERVPAADPPAWYDPVDRVSDGDPSVILADRIANEIAQLIDHGTIHDGKEGQRRISAGDFLILVQRRSGLFDQIIRACKARDLPMAGADRMKIGAELAVKDLTALLSFLALPEDDLSLAAALKSPLFGWSERDLFQLAAGRGTSFLWPTLRANREQHAGAFAVLDELRRIADFTRPFELLETILGRFDGRRKLLARLGPEAEDGIDELLSFALKYEQQNVPSLTGFLAELKSTELEIKRATDSSDGLVQVMTIHGAKGLERPIVILPDTIRGDPKGSRDIVLTGGGIPLWSQPNSRAPDLVVQAKEMRIRADLEERQRLLYVAMTRAKVWLIVAGIAPGTKPRTPQWHDMVKDGLKRAGAVWLSKNDGEILRLETGDWISTREINQESEPGEAVEDGGFRIPSQIPAGPPARKTISPTALGGEKALPGDAGQDNDDARQRGTYIHILLEHFPQHRPEDWEAVGTNLLAGQLSEDEYAALYSEAASCIEAHPRIFQKNGLTEVDLTALLPDGTHRLEGTVDRILTSENCVEIVDFKSNRIVPTRAEDTPEGILRQLGAYLFFAKAIWPKTEVRLTVLWTKNASAMNVPVDLAQKAFDRSPAS